MVGARGRSSTISRNSRFWKFAARSPVFVYRRWNFTDRRSTSIGSTFTDNTVTVALPSANLTSWSSGSAIAPDERDAAGDTPDEDVVDAVSGEEEGDGEEDTTGAASLRALVWLRARINPVMAVMIAARPVMMPGTVCHQLGVDFSSAIGVALL